MALLVGVATAKDSASDDRKELVASAEKQLHHAETYYWFGMAELGNMAAYRKGLRHLDDARTLAARLPESDAERARLNARIDGLQTDLEKQTGIAVDTLYGVFPLVRFLNRSIFAESLTLGTYEIIDDPAVMASTGAARLLALQTITEWVGRHQLDAVFTSIPHNPELENEVLYVFNSHPKFFVHNLREVIDAVDKEQLADFQAGNITPDVRDAMLSAFNVNDAIFVKVIEVDVVDGDHFYIVEGRIYRTGTESPTHEFAVMGFSRDRNAQFWPIIVSSVLLLGLAYAAFWIQFRVRQRATVRVSSTTFFVAPLAAFVIGRCTPWVLGPLIKRISPIPETLAIASFWVPCLAGAALTVVPMLVFWVLSKRLGAIWPVFSMDGRAAAVCAGIGAGSAAYLAVPLFLYTPENAPMLLVAATISVVGLGYLLGRALDGVDRLSMKVAIVPLLLSFFVGAAVFQGVASWTWASAVFVAAACGLPVLLHAPGRADKKRVSVHPAQSPQPMAAHALATPINKIADRAENPVYQRLEDFEGHRRALQPLVEGNTVHLGLFGAAGCGLSATAAVLIQDLTESLTTAGSEAVIMLGECANTSGERPPYGPFQKALAKHFEIELLAAPESKMADVNEALGEVFQSVVPFAGVLFPDTKGVAGTATAGEDIVPSIIWMLRKLSRRNPIVLFIDDAQWLDEASKALLIELLKQFPADGPEAIAIIVASHEEVTLEEIGFSKSHVREITFPTAEQQARILTNGVGLSPTAAEQVVHRVGSSTATQGGLFWLMQVVSKLGRADAFVASDTGAALRDGQWPRDILVPDEMRDVLADQLQTFSQRYRMIVECAACATEAREFSASLVAEALNEPRLDLLAHLDRIDRETSVLYDVHDEDDIFAFQSSILLDVLREELKIVEAGPDADVPQIIREYHARLGACLESSLSTSSNKLYVVANHFYAAGSMYADKGTKYCIEAALAAAAVLDFDASESFLARAMQCAQICGQQAQVEACRVEIDCRRAHVTGQAEDHARVANAGAKYLQQQSDASTRLMLAIAQVHYDAGKSSSDRTWFDRSLEIGREVIAGAETPRDEAAGRHFVAISLPYDADEERRSELRRALSLMEAEPEDTKDFELLGRIMGSLAETLTRGTAEDRSEAKRLFESRIELNQKHHVGDPRGQAMTHGGLGRLAFYYEPQDLDQAVMHFAKDLEISEAIGDQQGQIQMHSLLGACALGRDNIPVATTHYQQSWDLAKHPINKTFAAAGLLACYGRAHEKQGFDAMTRELLSLTDDGVPPVCQEELLKALTSCPHELFDAQTEELLARAREAAAATSNT
ncbi:MAG: AAA family ATPase [Pirellulales bacterium]|nr:AAA family ATPase [Pirellulales bacterium]